MKKYLIALLALLVIALAACSSDSELTKSGKDPAGIHHNRDTDQPAPQSWEGSDVDIGMTEESAYKNATLGISAAFPENLHISSEAELAAHSGLTADTFDRAAIADAIENGQTVEIFCASELAAPYSVTIRVLKNPLPDGDEAALISHFSAEAITEFEQTGVNVVSAVAEAEFCGQERPVLTLSGSAEELPLYETILYLPCGDLLYTVTVLSGMTDRSAELLGLFEATN